MAKLAGTIQIWLVASAFACIATHAQPASPPALVRYSFDDDLINSGPDTFSVFQFGQGSVRLSSLYRYSGYRSVELRDVPGDHSFPELQGYFALRTKGKLYLHFALMTADPQEELNIALAGPQWFTLRKDGIAFWLKTSNGYLTAISDSMPKKLFAMNAFVWYDINVAYDIDAGTYDLTIRQERLETPVFSVRGQANAPNQPGSRIDKFSFIGDHESDESKVVYYVDDVLVGVDESIVQQPFVAPGRRKLFVDYWNSARKAQTARPGPVPLMSLADLGIGERETAALRGDGVVELLGQILAGKTMVIPENTGDRSRTILQSVIAWNRGAEALKNGSPEEALAHFEEASRLVPSSRLSQIDAVIALTHLTRWEEVDRRLAPILPQWRDDPRLLATLAAIGLARGDFNNPAEADGSSGSLAEQYFLALLWKGDFAGAEAFAENRLTHSTAPEGTQWRERLGDAAFLAGDLRRARELYEASLVGHPQPTWVWLKLSDVYFKLGDFEQERAFRERVYGSLGER